MNILLLFSAVTGVRVPLISSLRDARMGMSVSSTCPSRAQQNPSTSCLDIAEGCSMSAGGWV